MKIGVLFPSRFDDPGEFLADARAMEAAGVDSVWLDESDDRLDALLVLAAIAAVTTDVRLGLVRREAKASSDEQRRTQTLEALSRRRLVPRTERWLHVPFPADREVWAATLEQASGKAEGVIVPMDRRLLDILRHPNDAIDRSDLILVQG